MTPQPSLLLLVPSPTLGSRVLPGLSLVLPPLSLYLSQTPCACGVVEESAEGRGGWGQTRLWLTQAAPCPRLFSCCPARLLPPPHPHTPSSLKPLIPDSCRACQPKWGSEMRSMLSACCCSGCLHHLTVWGQRRPHLSPPSPQEWPVPGKGPFLSLSPEVPVACHYTSRGSLQRDRE